MSSVNTFVSILRDEGDSVVSEIISALLQNDAVATGKTLESLEMTVDETGLLITGNAAFAPNRRDNRSFVEAGRGVGGVPPFVNIADWAIARGIAQSYDDEIINAIRWKIAREGSKSWRENKTRDIVATVVTDERIKVIIDRLSEEALSASLSKFTTQIRN